MCRPDPPALEGDDAADAGSVATDDGLVDWGGLLSPSHVPPLILPDGPVYVPLRKPPSPPAAVQPIAVEGYVGLGVCAHCDFHGQQRTALVALLRHADPKKLARFLGEERYVEVRPWLLKQARDVRRQRALARGQPVPPRPGAPLLQQRGDWEKKKAKLEQFEALLSARTRQGGAVYTQREAAKRVGVSLNALKGYQRRRDREAGAST